MNKLLPGLVPVLFKTILPSVLSAVGVVAAALYSDGFRALQ